MKRYGLFASISLIAALLIGCGKDFADFYNAGRALLQGVSPYTVERYYSPVHVAIMFMPLAWIRFDIAFRLYTFVSCFAWLWVFSRLTSDRVIWLLCAGSSFIGLSLMFGNIEVLPLLALYAPPWIGILLAITKPQVGIFLASFIVWRLWREHGVKSVILSGIPAGVVMVTSLLAGMRLPNLSAVDWNLSLWPLGFIGAAYLIYRAFKRNDDRSAFAAGVFASPYVGPMSYVALAPLLVRSRRGAVLLAVLSWVIVAVWIVRAHG